MIGGGAADHNATLGYVPATFLLRIEPPRRRGDANVHGTLGYGTPINIAGVRRGRSELGDGLGRHLGCVRGWIAAPAGLYRAQPKARTEGAGVST